MPNTLDITCKIIPLYRVRLMFERRSGCGCHVREDEKHIIADSLQGLIEGLADAELDYEASFEEDDNVRMAFDIQDFLLMPHINPDPRNRARKYSLFDIDEVDCATNFASIDSEIWYDLRFAKEKNINRDMRHDHEHAEFAEPYPVSEVEPNPGEEQFISTSELMDWEKEYKYRDAIMMALYHMAQKSDYRSARIAREAREEAELEAGAKKRILEVIAKEADREGREEARMRAEAVLMAQEATRMAAQRGDNNG